VKALLRNLIRDALLRAREAGDLAVAEIPSFIVEVPRDEGHGDLASNVAMTLARPERKAPRAIADTIIRHLGDAGGVLAKVEPAGPGFLNFTFSDEAWRVRLLEIRDQPGWRRPENPDRVLFGQSHRPFAHRPWSRSGHR
jgi:arginyl-tRNA synthetase